MASRDDWLFRLTADDVAEIEAAVDASRDIPIEAIDAARFPLPRLGPRLSLLLDELLLGRGFTLVRGLPVERMDTETAARAYWGLGSHFGSARSQNARGHLLGHVIDLSRSADDPTARLYQTSARQNYHTDSADLVGLLCLRKARKGGASSIVSSVTVHDEMLSRAPNLAHALFRPVAVDRRAEIPGNRKPWYRISVFNWHDGVLTTAFTRPYIESAQRFDNAPKLGDDQREAIELFQQLCDDPDIHLEMDFEPGDMQFLHNHQILHDRTAFEDWPDPALRRHLLRLWLCPPRGRELPPIFEDRQGSLDIGNRGGIIVPGTAPHAPLDVV